MSDFVLLGGNLCGKQKQSYLIESTIQLSGTIGTLDYTSLWSGCKSWGLSLRPTSLSGCVPATIQLVAGPLHVCTSNGGLVQLTWDIFTLAPFPHWLFWFWTMTYTVDEANANYDEALTALMWVSGI